MVPSAYVRQLSCETDKYFQLTVQQSLIIYFTIPTLVSE